MIRIPTDTLLAIERRFHDLILETTGNLVEEHHLTLPQLAPLLAADEPDEPEAWFPVPGMCGGFGYWIEGDGIEARLIVESWCRVVAGSGRRHVVTATGCELVASGFV